MSNWSNTCPDIPYDWKGNTERKMNTPTPNRKKLVYGGQKGLDSHIARLVKSGWKVVTTQICYQVRGKKVYIAELEKE